MILLKQFLFLIVIVVGFVGCGMPPASTPMNTLDEDASGVIYGSNSIQNISDAVPNSMSSVALMKKKTARALLAGRGVYSVEENFGSLEGMSWAAQPSAAFCSGVLIAKDRVLTAGHCLRNKQTCAEIMLVFGYDHVHGPKKEMKAIACRAIEKIGTDLGVGVLDYAVIRLAEPVTFPVARVSQTALQINAEIYALGYPLGSYKKKADGVLRRPQRGAIVDETNLDVFQGNSGSPVFSKSDNLLVGIISGGEQDFTLDENNRPTVKHCANNGCSGEFMVPIQKILADLPKR